MWFKLRSLLDLTLRRSVFEDRTAQQTQSQLESLTEELVKAGNPREEAERLAKLKFGGVVHARGQHREARGLRMLEEVRQDVRYGACILAKKPGFTLTAVIMLSLGIGANTAIFTVFDTLLLRPLPYARAERTVLLWGNFLKLDIRQLPARPAEYLDYRERTQSFAQVAAFQTDDMNLTGHGDPERVTVARVSANLFPMLGAEALHGRLMTEEETQGGNDHVVVVSHAFWQRRLGGTPDITGRSLRLNQTPYMIVGVMPAGFSFPHASLNFTETAVLWLPLVLDRKELAQGGGGYSLNVIAQLKPEVTLAQAQAEMNVLAEYHDRVLGFKGGYRGPKNEDGGWRITVVPLLEQVAGSSRRALWILFGAVGLILLIACANVANLLLVRATARQREMSIRTALGAGRGRLIRQLLVESLLLAGLGGAIGTWLAWRGVKAVIMLSPASLPRASEVSLNAHVLTFTLVVSVLTGVLFGLAPTWQVLKLDAWETLRKGGPQASGEQRRWLEWLVIVEIALTLPLLIGAGLLLNSFIRVQGVSPGVLTDQIVVAEINLPAAQYADPARAAAFFADLASRVSALPGVSGTSYSTRPLLSNVSSSDPFTIEGRPMTSEPNFAGWQRVAPDYFRTLGIPLTAGRDFTGHDSESVPEAIINEALAKRYFPAGDALGQRIILGSPSPTNRNRFATIIGIARDVPHRNIESPAKPEFFLHFAQQPHLTAHLYVRVSGEPSGFASAIRQSVLSIDPAQPVKSIQPMKTVIDTTLAPRRFTTYLLAVFALLGLVLTTMGVYSVNAYAFALSKQEIGIRMALGAQRNDVFRLIMQRGVILVLIGLGLGMAASLAVTRWLRSLLFNVGETDPLTFAGVSMLLLLIALLACFLPARRATKLDPITVLRGE